jgi:PST family polysaccharide transporter
MYARVRHYGSLLAWRFDSRIARSLLKDSWPFIFIAAFTTIFTRIDQVMLKHLMDSSAVGLYDAAVRIAEVWLFIPSLIAASVFPAIVNAKQTSFHEYKKRLVLLCALMGAIAIAIALLASLYAAPLITMLYGTAFAASAGVFVI